jgi:peptidyl-prolyl cis-trans isomerase B (cyclophilin B)
VLTRLPALAALLALSLTACSGDDTSGTDAGSEPTADAGAGSPTTAEGACAYPSDGRSPAKEGIEPPPAEPTVDGQVTAVMRTESGDLTVELDAAGKPCTVGSFVSLAEQGYYEGSGCHRMADAPGFSFLQCGDPTGTGTGGPGYTIPDEITGQETYPAGTIAMANTGIPDSGGGQFFMIFEDSQFPPAYTVFGQLDKASITTLRKATAKGHDGAFEPSPGGGHPNEPVTINEIVVR